MVSSLSEVDMMISMATVMIVMMMIEGMMVMVVVMLALKTVTCPHMFFLLDVESDHF